MGSCCLFLPSAFLSRSVTFRDKKPVYLLQIEMNEAPGSKYLDL